MSELVRVADAAVHYSKAPLASREAYIWKLASASAMLPRSVTNGNQNILPEQAAAKIFYLAEVGAMMGIHPLEAIGGIHMVEGRPTISAGLMSSLVRQAGHKLRVSEVGEWGPGFRAVCVIIRKDDPEFEHVATFSYEDAQRAGLLAKKGPWQQHPKAMCKARAISACARMGAEDALGSARYTPEELDGNLRVNEEGEVIDLGEVPSVADPAPQQAAPSHPTQSAPAAPAAAPPAPAEPAPAPTVTEPVAAPQAAPAEPPVTQAGVDYSAQGKLYADAGRVDLLTQLWTQAKAGEALRDAAVLDGVVLVGADGVTVTVNTFLRQEKERALAVRDQPVAEAPTLPDPEQIEDAVIVSDDAPEEPAEGEPGGAA